MTISAILLYNPKHKMSIEQKPGIAPEYPFTIAHILEATGIPDTANNKRLVKGQIDKNTRTPLTYPDGSVTLSEEDFQLVVQAINEKVGNSSLRTDFETAILPDGSQITGGKTLHIRQITAIVTRAREQKQTFSLEQIMIALDPTPKRSNASKANAMQNAKDKINAYRKKIKPNGWVIDSITPKEDKEGRKNPQYWFRHKDEHPFTPLPNTEALAKEEILPLPNGKMFIVGEGLGASAIRGAILAQKNGMLYLDREMAALVKSSFNNQNEERKVNFVANEANRVLREYGYVLAGYETKVNGRARTAFRIETKPTPTSSPEQKSPTS